MPKSGDFRVQEEHGGNIVAWDADEHTLATGAAVLESLEKDTLYARVDLVRADDGNSWWLMELELIEPSLYLRTDSGAAMRFALAIDKRFQEFTSKRAFG